MGLVAQLVGTSVRVHWFFVLSWLTFQWVSGSLLSHSSVLLRFPPIGEHELFSLQEVDAMIPGISVAKMIGNGELMRLHRYSSWGLCAFTVVLFLEKMFIAAGGLRRGKIRSALVDFHVKSHFLSVTVLLALQMLTSVDYREDVREYLHGHGPDFLKPLVAEGSEALMEAHAALGFLLVFFALILSLEKIYLVFFNRPSRVK